MRPAHALVTSSAESPRDAPRTNQSQLNYILLFTNTTSLARRTPPRRRQLSNPPRLRSITSDNDTAPCDQHSPTAKLGINDQTNDHDDNDDLATRPNEPYLGGQHQTKGYRPQCRHWPLASRFRKVTDKEQERSCLPVI
mmetsp:Transcript_23310/g.37155  ORF Transcript_23310/g.37155 Transcript_23310/m.37155 type:complete len:139 (+) Transcript_23310:1466-1882(+)